MSLGVGGEICELSDFGAHLPDAKFWALISTSGAPINWVGFFVDIWGSQVSEVLTLVVTTTGRSIGYLYNAAKILTATLPLPANFAGFVGNLPTDVSFSYGANITDSTLITTPVDFTPLITGPRIYAGASATLGRIA